MEKERVLVGMSGGIDSTAACLLLQEQGYEVVGLTLRLCDDGGDGNDASSAVQEARAVADRLGIEHHVRDERDAFRSVIMQGFADEYLAGRTPNPCVLCNPRFKFRLLLEEADRLGCSRIATGHYVRLAGDSRQPLLREGRDGTKDQSYFLWRVPVPTLARCLFPLGDLTKQQVRDYLAARGLGAKAADGESTDICFVPNDYRDFLRRQVPDIDERIGEGDFVDYAGRKLGHHAGYAYYTVGQRKGLGIALGYPAYVLKTNPDRNTVMLGREEELLTQHMLVEDLCVHPSVPSLAAVEALAVRIRYRSRPVPCTLEREVQPGLWLVRFPSPVSAVTPGQSAVFYRGDELVGGAFIANQRGISQWIKP